MTLYTPFFERSMAVVNDGQRKGRINELASNAYLGDPQAMAELYGVAPQVAESLERTSIMGVDTQAAAGGLITGNSPSGLSGAGLRLEGMAAQNAAISDLLSGGAQIYSNYLQRPRVKTPMPQTPYYGGGT